MLSVFKKILSDNKVSKKVLLDSTESKKVLSDSNGVQENTFG